MGKHNLSTKIIPTNIDYQAFLHDRVNKYLEEYVASNNKIEEAIVYALTAPGKSCLLYTSPSPRDISGSRMPSSA